MLSSPRCPCYPHQGVIVALTRLSMLPSPGCPCYPHQGVHVTLTRVSMLPSPGCPCYPHQGVYVTLTRVSMLPSPGCLFHVVSLTMVSTLPLGRVLPFKCPAHSKASALPFPVPFLYSVAIHRIDRLTSGLLIFAKSLAKAQTLEAQIRGRELEKEYVCRVSGEFPS